MEGSEESMETITATGESTALKGEDDFHNPQYRLTRYVKLITNILDMILEDV